MSDNEHNKNESDCEEIDLTENPLYQVLSAFFEDEEGNNLCYYINKMTEAIKKNTEIQTKILKQINQ